MCDCGKQCCDDLAVDMAKNVKASGLAAVRFPLPRPVATDGERGSYFLAALVAHEANRAIRSFLGEQAGPHFEDLSWHKRRCLILGVENVVENPTLTPRESHEGWLKYKREDGWVYGETEDVSNKTHPCMVEYDELPKEQRLKDVMFITIVRSVLGLY